MHIEGFSWGQPACCVAAPLLSGAVFFLKWKLEINKQTQFWKSIKQFHLLAKYISTLIKDIRRRKKYYKSTVSPCKTNQIKYIF